MALIVDPFDENYTLDNEGRRLTALRVVPAGTLENPEAPTVADIVKLIDAPIVAYARVGRGDG